MAKVKSKKPGPKRQPKQPAEPTDMERLAGMIGALLLAVISGGRSR